MNSWSFFVARVNLASSAHTIAHPGENPAACGEEHTENQQDGAADTKASHHPRSEGITALDGYGC
jgi:hypothetical protein